MKSPATHHPFPFPGWRNINGKNENYDYKMASFEQECKRIAAKEEHDRTLKEIAMLKQYTQENWQAQFEYDQVYDDDGGVNPVDQDNVEWLDESSHPIPAGEGQGNADTGINCPSCGKFWNLSKNNSCECGATLSNNKGQQGEGKDEPCAKPNCDCIKIAERETGGPVKSYLCLAKQNLDALKIKK